MLLECHAVIHKGKRAAINPHGFVCVNTNSITLFENCPGDGAAFKYQHKVCHARHFVCQNYDAAPPVSSILPAHQTGVTFAHNLYPKRTGTMSLGKRDGGRGGAVWLCACGVTVRVTRTLTKQLPRDRSCAVFSVS